MALHETNAKSILRKHRKIDSWFLSRYGMNLYRGCAHNCVYCDGRSERYYVDGDFGRDITVKRNAIELLKRELDPARKRVPMKSGFVLLGGGVGDSYQPLEEEYCLSRAALRVIHEFGMPVHVLTKSTLVTRDTDILIDINRQSRAIVSFSMSSADDGLSAIVEPNAPPPSERLSALSVLKGRGLSCGVFLMPVIPFVSDTPSMIELTVRKAKEAGADFIIFGGLTLKEGRQKSYFYDMLETHFPERMIEYLTIYQDNKWGSATEEYYHSIHATFDYISTAFSMPKRIPTSLFSDYIDENDLVTVILEHIDYLVKLKGGTSPYGYAANSVSQLKKPLSTVRHELKKLKGVGNVTRKIILEILDTGSSSYYRMLMK